MTPEQKQELIRLLQKGEEISPEWARILFPPEKREYELVYHGKDREEDIIADALAVPLQPVRTFGRNGVDWHNKLIFGDNLQAMKTLLAMKKNGDLCNADGTQGVRLVYIDPPFATKQDFQGSDDQKAYQDKIAGAEFLEFMRQRLIFLRELLTEDGTIYVHLDYRKLHYIKALGDEVFGENNFMNEVIWCYRERGISKTFWNNKHQTILVWAKRRGEQLFNSDAARVPYSEEYLKKFKHEDENGKYQIRGKNIKGSPVQRADGLTPEAEKKYPGLTYRQYMKKGQLPLDWWELSLLNKAANERTSYPTQKPESLLARIVKASSNPGDIVMDCFAGSGTTLAVAEKLKRRWIGIDCGKLAIYTAQKRLLSIDAGYDLTTRVDGSSFGELAKDLSKELENCSSADEKIAILVDWLERSYNKEFEKAKPIVYGKKCSPFTLYNAGLYDFSKLKELIWQDWRFFALQLFQCRDEKHRIGGIEFDGYRQSASVMVYNHVEVRRKGAVISEDTIQEIHEAAGSRVGSKVFIIAPSLAFDFQQDYIDFDKVRYYALRIPYSIIRELHRCEFKALKQPSDEMAVNDTVEAVGFDFIRTPELKYKTGIEKPKGELFEYGVIKIETFKSDAVVREPLKKKGNLETLSMVLLDLDYDEKSKVFNLDEIQYATAIEKASWKVLFRRDQLGRKLMAVFLDIYGNEARILIDAAEFGKLVAKKSKGKKK
jgi:site-specific DNA-methyltransferase (adenine-specific)/adenine-specific DNA-methyltransferase